MGEAGEHDALVAALGVDDAARRALVSYLDLLASWSSRVNLTAARAPAARFDLLVRPVAAVAALPAAGTLLDVGSGNGSPGLVFAALRPDVRVTLLEPRVRRWAFLREAARAMGVPAEVLRQRHDEYSGPPAGTVTVRALKLPPDELAGLAAPGGRVIVFGAELPEAAALTAMAAPQAGVRVYRRY